MKPAIASIWTWLIYVAYLLSCLFCFYGAEKIFDKANSCDLLYRVVGTRLMQDDRPAYFFKWNPGEPDKYFHFRQRENQPINGVTVTPTMLRLNGGFSHGDFCDGSRRWFYAQCFILFLTGLLLLVCIPGLIAKTTAGFSFILFFAISRNFYAHLNVGQVYVLYAFIFSIYYALLRSRLRHRFFLLAAITLIAAALRPIFLVALVPVFFRRPKKQVIAGGMLGLLIVLFQVWLCGDYEYWREYFSAMQQYARDIPGTMQYIEPPLQYYLPKDMISCVFPPKAFDRYGADGLPSLQYFLERRGIAVSNTLAFALAACVIVAGLSLARLKKDISVERLFVLVFLCYIFTELLIPAYRFPYNLVEWCAPVMVMLSGFRKNPVAAIVLLAGLAMNQLPIAVPYVAQLGELVMMAVALYFVFGKTSDTPEFPTIGDQ